MSRTVSSAQNKKSRNILGCIVYFDLAIIFGFITEIFMICREIYQWKHYKLAKFEWDDIFRYTISIISACVIHYVLLWQFYTTYII